MTETRKTFGKRPRDKEPARAGKEGPKATGRSGAAHEPSPRPRKAIDARKKNEVSPPVFAPSHQANVLPCTQPNGTAIPSLLSVGKTMQAQMYRSAQNTIDGLVREPTQRYVPRGAGRLSPCWLRVLALIRVAEVWEDTA